MPLVPPLHVRTLGPEDIPGAMRLSTEAGWNQLAADWRRLLGLWPHGCRGIFSDWLVSTGTLVGYLRPENGLGGPLPRSRAVGWIGMILVDGRCRGRGLGTTMMRELLHVARDRGLVAVGLDATDMGRPVYEKLGFVPDSRLNRWVGPGITAPPLSDAMARVRPLEPADWPAVAALDADATGIERSMLLEHLAQEAGARAVVAIDRGRVTAFGLARPGRTARAIGPLVASTTADAQAVFERLRTEAAATTFMVDVPEHAPLEEALRDAGFAVSRRLTRMTLTLDPPEPTGADAPLPQEGLLRGPCREALVHAAAGFELG